MLELTDRDREMYKRQIQMPGFGEEAQQKLKKTCASGSTPASAKANESRGSNFATNSPKAASEKS